VSPALEGRLFASRTGAAHASSAPPSACALGGDARDPAASEQRARRRRALGTSMHRV